MPNDCLCYVRNLEIVYCPLHEAAPELLRLAVEARDVLALLVPYGKIHTVEGVAYPDGTHSDAVDRGERVLNQIRAALARSN